MFWKVFEWIVRIVYFKRFATAKRIGRASELLVAGRPAEGLDKLDKLEIAKLHESLHPLYFYTQGRLLDGASRFEEATHAYDHVLELKPDHHRARLELAVLKGRLFDFTTCRTLLTELQTHEEIAEDVRNIRALLEQTEDGSRLKEFQTRAEAFAHDALHTNLPALPPEQLLPTLTKWATSHPQEAQDSCDEIAILLGQAQVEHTDGATWKLSLAIDGSQVLLPDGTTYHPFTELQHLFPKT